MHEPTHTNIITTIILHWDIVTIAVSVLIVYVLGLAAAAWWLGRNPGSKR